MKEQVLLVHITNLQMKQAGDKETTDFLVVDRCNDTLQYRDKLDVSFRASLRWSLC